MTHIHPAAIVHNKARLGENVSVGPFAIIGEDVEVGDQSRIHAHVLLADGARIGRNCQIHDSTVVASVPQDLKFKEEPSTMEIGDNTVIREFCTLNRATTPGGKTSIGKDCLIMAYCHAAHDCVIGDHVIMANGVQLAGHITVEDWVIIGGLTAVHQFCHIGQHAMVGGGFRVVQDVPPYILAAGEPLTFKGLNIVGLKRRGFTTEMTRNLRRCYRIIYRSRLNMTQAMDRIRTTLEMTPEIESVIRFIERSTRGIVR
ncbi:MAG TPA: acyl-ACP--UDP-N-acetylglucosamine O-acyltransferase [bacterium]|nr:acyl-ACP--UDP-N-acetylglucosamine O-acyltransferase [bacterium]